MHSEKAYYIGIDTSCYTTSLAVVDTFGTLIYDGRILLTVPQGGRGLRQSEAVFQHHNNISGLVKECFDTLPTRQIKGIAVSSKPRNAEDSYMPVFTAGVNTAQIIASSLKIPMIEVSHQENHIIAGIGSSGHDFQDKFWAYHISGGTTELLYVQKGERMQIDLAGGSNDLKAGQFIDRAGVAMGLGFPCGAEMDRLSADFSGEPLGIPISVQGAYTSFSGPESHIQRMVASGDFEKGRLCQGIFLCIAKSIEKTLLNAVKERQGREVLMVGGVASNTVIRKYLTESPKLKGAGIDIFFAGAKYASDNGVGTALFGKMQIEKMEA